MKNETKIIIGTVLATVLILGLGMFVFSKNAAPDIAVSNDPISEEVLVRENSHVRGKEDSEVVLVEFADFECPACEYAHPMIEKVFADYGDRVKFVYRHFPLHFNSNTAISASEAAAEQGMFWEMYNKLYGGFDDWANKRDDKFTKDLFTSYAEELGLDMDAFEKAFKKGYDSFIANEVADVNAARVGGTPTFFLNGKEIGGGGVPNESSLRKLLDEALEEAENSD